MRITFATLLACLVFLALGSFALSAPTPKPTAKPTPKAAALSKAQQQKLAELKASAPADEYFGKMKLSFLGINNTFRDQAIRAGDHTTNPSVTGPLGWAEDALHAWQKKYSKDPQLARSYYLAFLADRKIWLADFQQRATAYLVVAEAKVPDHVLWQTGQGGSAKGHDDEFLRASNALRHQRSCVRHSCAVANGRCQKQHQSQRYPGALLHNCTLADPPAGYFGDTYS